MTLQVIYLVINALLNLIFSGWCFLYPESTAAAVGYTLNGQKGFAEYAAVYGGIQAGMGIFFALCAWQSQLTQPGLVMAACIYGGIAIFRTAAIIEGGTNIENGWIFYTIEVTFALSALWLTAKA